MERLGGLCDSVKASPTGTLTLPANASEIMILALDPDVSVTQLARVTSRDQVLAARMLRLANSAYCAPLQEITTISEAVVRLGTASVRNVVSATCMASRLQSGNTYGAHGRGLAAHGIGTAFLAQLVARVAMVNQEEAFLYGLVHDLGKLLVLQLTKDYVRGGGKAPDDAEVLAVIEARHAEFGGRVLREWQLPPSSRIRSCITTIRTTALASDGSAVCYVANRLSHRYGFGCAATPDRRFSRTRSRCGSGSPRRGSGPRHPRAGTVQERVRRLRLIGGLSVFRGPGSIELAFPPRDHDRRQAVAEHVDRGAQHVEQRVDAEDHEHRLGGQAERRHRAHQDHERAARHAGDALAREHQRQQQQQLLAEGQLDAGGLRDEDAPSRDR